MGYSMNMKVTGGGSIVEVRAGLVKPYGEMISALFKVDGFSADYAAAMHAAIGISGEVAELRAATDRINILEELGDILFYIEGCCQQFPGFDLSVTRSPLPITRLNFNVLSAYEALTNVSGALLDAVKKGWVYNKLVNAALIEYALVDLIDITAKLIEGLGFTRLEVLDYNQQKLIGPNGRYPDQKYTDQAAQARADKNGQE